MKQHFVRKAGACVAGVLLGLAMLGADGCVHNPPNTSPQVVFTQTLLTASEVTVLVSDGLVAANSAFDTLQAQGSIEAANYAKSKAWIKRIARANDKAIAAIRAAQAGDTAVDWRSALLGVSAAAAAEDPAAYGFKNPDTQAAVKVGLASLQLALSAITASYRGAK
jgi:hypothetical protein